MRLWLLLVMLGMGGGSATATPAQVVLVRHAEKATDDGGGDPALSEAGKLRAESLAELMKTLRVTDVFTSQYQRTIQTAAPGVKAHRLFATVVEARDPQALVERIQLLPATAIVLVVGHSNTVPDLAQRLGGKGKAIRPMAETEYDRVILLRISPSGTVKTDELHYNPSTK